jgi:hypothetical protein
VVDVLLLLGLEYRSGSFIFLVSFSFLVMCILTVGNCVVAEAGCNWYLSILIYSFYQKNMRCSLRVC